MVQKFVDFISFLDSHSGSLTFLITFVYVVATIFICWANIRSANASRAQLEEMRQQYKEENRPIIEVEFLFERNSFIGLRFINHGKITAQNVQIILNSAFIDKLPDKPIKELLLKLRDEMCVIGVGQHYDLFLGSGRKLLNMPNLVASGEIKYCGHNENYSSHFNIDITNYSTIYSIDGGPDDICKRLDKHNQELRDIKNLLYKAQNKEITHV